jgi:muramoyltetrapeptide carboxypeptidase
MRRRQFIIHTALATLATACKMPKSMSASKNTALPLIRPARLREGATVALIAPSSPAAEQKIEKAILNLTQMGYSVQEGRSLRARTGFLAGTDADRLADLHNAFQNPDIDAIWCVRGGYGAARLLPHLDYELIRQHPKPLIGYSDITALHIAIHQQTGLVTFHGPVGGEEYPPETLQNLEAIIKNPVYPWAVAGSSNLITELEQVRYDEWVGETMAKGSAEGVLTGGNLAILASLVGTSWQPVFAGKIAFIEDIGEVPYRIDRMLTQLLQATDLKQAAGIALGQFTDCNPKGNSPSFRLKETLRERLGGLGIPVAYGLPFGHLDLNATLPYGIRARLDADALRLTILESAVI